MYYSDRDLIVATQIAYYRFDQEVLKHYRYRAPLREILKVDSTQKEHLLKNLEGALKRNEPLVIYRAQSALKLYDEVLSPNSFYGSWIIRYIKDNNVTTGFYGCLIETSSDTAIIAFRGSESNTIRQIKEDWIDANFGLLHLKETKQQSEATQFMNEIERKFFYRTYAVTGHSLGGNLTFHGAITAPLELQNKLNQIISFDGPGYSGNYRREYCHKFRYFPGHLTHYRWSLVGSLLYPIPIANDKSIRVKTQNVPDQGKFNYLFEKHDTCFVLFDEDNNVLEGRTDLFAVIMKWISRIADKMI